MLLRGFIRWSCVGFAPVLRSCFLSVMEKLGSSPFSFVQLMFEEQEVRKSGLSELLVEPPCGWPWWAVHSSVNPTNPTCVSNRSLIPLQSHPIDPCSVAHFLFCLHGVLPGWSALWTSKEKKRGEPTLCWPLPLPPTLLFGLSLGHCCVPCRSYTCSSLESHTRGHGWHHSFARTL